MVTKQKVEELVYDAELFHRTHWPEYREFLRLIEKEYGGIKKLPNGKISNQDLEKNYKGLREILIPFSTPKLAN